MSAAPRRVLRAVLGLLAITAFGTIGYMWVEELVFLDALYMTVITVATVGYGEVRPLHPEGRIFTMVLIVSAASTDCTTGPRNGLVSGCFPLDPFYKQHPAAEQLKALDEGRLKAATRPATQPSTKAGVPEP